MDDQIDGVDGAIQPRSANMDFPRWTRESGVEWEFSIREKRGRTVG